MPEPTLERICYALGLEEYEQDWGIIHSDHRRLEEFLSYARSGLDFNSAELFALVQLVLASANDALLQGDPVDVRQVLSPLELAPDILRLEYEYWAGLPEEECPIARLLREHPW